MKRKKTTLCTYNLCRISSLNKYTAREREKKNANILKMMKKKPKNSISLKSTTLSNRNEKLKLTTVASVIGLGIDWFFLQSRALHWVQLKMDAIQE